MTETRCSAASMPGGCPPRGLTAYISPFLACTLYQSFSLWSSLCFFFLVFAVTSDTAALFLSALQRKREFSSPCNARSLVITATNSSLISHFRGGLAVAEHHTLTSPSPVTVSHITPDPYNTPFPTAALPTTAAALTTSGAAVTPSGAAVTPSGAAVNTSGAALNTSCAALTTCGSGITPSGAALTTSGASLTPSGAALTPSGAARTPGAALTTSGAALPTCGVADSASTARAYVARHSVVVSSAPGALESSSSSFSSFAPSSWCFPVLCSFFLFFSSYASSTGPVAATSSWERNHPSWVRRISLFPLLSCSSSSFPPPPLLRSHRRVLSDNKHNFSFLHHVDRWSQKTCGPIAAAVNLTPPAYDVSSPLLCHPQQSALSLRASQQNKEDRPLLCSSSLHSKLNKPASFKAGPFAITCLLPLSAFTVVSGHARQSPLFFSPPPVVSAASRSPTVANAAATSDTHSSFRDERNAATMSMTFLNASRTCRTPVRRTAPQLRRTYLHALGGASGVAVHSQAPRAAAATAAAADRQTTPPKTLAKAIKFCETQKTSTAPPASPLQATATLLLAPTAAAVATPPLVAPTAAAIAAPPLVAPTAAGVATTPSSSSTAAAATAIATAPSSSTAAAARAIATAPSSSTAAAATAIATAAETAGASKAQSSCAGDEGLTTETNDGIELLLAKPRGFCAGVSRAIGIVEEALRVWGPPVYVRHSIVHNEVACENLRRKGAIFVEEIEDIPHGAVAIFSAHGVSPAVRSAAAARDLCVVDATCPLVSKVHVYVKQQAAAGYHIILIGHRNHVEVEGTRGEAPADAVTIVETVQDVERLPFAPDAKLYYVTQTTLSLDDCQAIRQALLRRYPSIKTIPSGSICYATTNRQHALRALVPLCDLALVVGSNASSNAKRLVEVATRRGLKAYLVNDASDIKREWLQGVRRIALTSSASTPQATTAAVIERLQMHGVRNVREVETVHEKEPFWKFPQNLRDAAQAVPAREEELREKRDSTAISSSVEKKE